MPDVFDDILLFAVLPYVACVLFLVVTIQRYRQRKFTYSSLSSQFLENRMHFWGSVPFHYGILFVLAGHAVGFFMPQAILGWNASPLRLFILEVTGLAMALLALIGLVNIVLRRRANPKIRKVTNLSDWILYAMLLVQIASGIGVAVGHGWGSSWFATSISPWLWSLLTLNPEVAYVASLPWLVQVHIVSAFLLIAVFPFTRLVHILVIPNPYLWRRTQVVIWNRPRRSAGPKS
ncbi:MAG: respiratory nitrate reductase subunit gamma [Planctomycetes bacterium]|nr:respiratory nitrate reductase subunit gamma [Planctomycetota bacterium]